MTTMDIFTLVASALSLVFSGVAIYLNVRIHRARKAREENMRAKERYRAVQALDFARRYGAVTPHKLADVLPPLPPRKKRPEDEDDYRPAAPSIDPSAFGSFIATLPSYEETEVKMAASPPGPEAWVGGGGDFSGGGASGSWDSGSSDSGSSSSDSSSSDSGSSDCGSSDTSSSSGSCGTD